MTINGFFPPFAGAAGTPPPSELVAVVAGFSGADVEEPVAALVTSPDSVAWTNRPASYLEFSNIFDVTGDGAGIYINVGYGFTGDDPTNVPFIFKSTNGLIWTEQAQSMFTVGKFFCCAFGNGLYIAGGQEDGTGIGRLGSSPNGTTWTLRATPFDTPSVSAEILAAYYSAFDAKYLIGGFIDTDGGISTSPDGITWSANKTNGFDGAAGAVQAFADNGAGVIVAVGTNSSGADSVAHIEVSPDGGNTWTAKSFASFGAGGSVASGVAFHAGKFYACGWDDSLVGHLEVSSDNGNTWAAVDISNILLLFSQFMNDIKWSALFGCFIMVGQNGGQVAVIATSTTGASGTWVAQVSGFLGTEGSANAAYSP